MFIIDNPNLPATPVTSTGGIGFLINEVSLPATAQVNPLVVLPGIASAGEPQNEVVEIVNPSAGNVYTLEIQDARDVLAVNTPTVVATPAVNVADPQPGEFVYDPYSSQIQLVSEAPLETLSVTVLKSAIAGVPRNDLIPGPHPEWFTRYPVAGGFSIGLSFEQQPTGSLELECQRSQVVALTNAFKPDTRIDMYGYAFRVTQVSITQSSLATQPQGRFILNVSLSGANEREIAEPITVRDILELAGSTVESPITETTVQQIGQVAGVTVEAPEMEVSLDDLNSDDIFDLETEFTDRLRHQGLFADYNADMLLARPIDTVATWAFDDRDCLDDPQVTYLGRQNKKALDGEIDLSPPLLQATVLPTATVDAPVITIEAEDENLIGITNEFPVTKVDGVFLDNGFDDEDEDVLGNNVAEPNWVRRSPERVTLVKGDEDLESPPEDTQTIETTSLCFVNSGVTKTQEEETSEDGVPVSVRSRTYGFVFLSKDHIASVDGEDILRISNPGSVWELIRDVTTTWLYDDDTGYELGTVTTGRELFSFKSESDELETYDLSFETDPESIADLATYEFKWRSVDEASGKRLRRLSSVYNDVSPNEGKYVYFEQTGPNGETITRRKRDPSFVEPYYVETEITHANSFAQTPNPEPPETIGTVPRRKPNLTTGRESFNRNDIKVKPSAATRRVIRSSSIVPATTGAAPPLTRTRVVRGAPPDAYVTTTQEMSAEGPEYSDFAARTTFADSLGRPGEANRKPSNFTQVEPESGQSGNELPVDQTDYEYIATSPGYDPTDPVRTTLSFPYAETVGEAEIAVNTYAIAAEITNPARSVSILVPINLQIRPGDRVTVTLAGIVYKCRVNTVSHQADISGLVSIPNAAGIAEDVLEITGSTSLELSPDRTPQITFTRRFVAQDDDVDSAAETLSFTSISSGSNTTLAMGSLLTGKLTRRRPNG